MLYQIYIIKSHYPERYEYYGKTTSVPQFNAIIKNLRSRGKSCRVITTYTDGTQCVGDYFCNKSAETGINQINTKGGTQ